MEKSNQSIKTKIMAIMRRIPAKQSTAAIHEVGQKFGNTFLGGQMHFALGDVFDRLGRYPEAMEQYQEGLNIQPDFGRGYFRLGKDYEVFRRDFQAAKRNYSQAMLYDHGDTEMQARAERLEAHMANQGNDLSMRLKNVLRAH
jgi:tetratricopeptide (TPR) repeat protein